MKSCPSLVCDEDVGSNRFSIEHITHIASDMKFYVYMHGHHLTTTTFLLALLFPELITA
jgi:hypothetical protein